VAAFFRDYLNMLLAAIPKKSGYNSRITFVLNSAIGAKRVLTTTRCARGCYLLTIFMVDYFYCTVHVHVRVQYNL